MTNGRRRRNDEFSELVGDGYNDTGADRYMCIDNARRCLSLTIFIIYPLVVLEEIDVLYAYRCTLPLPGTLEMSAAFGFLKSKLETQITFWQKH